MTLDEVITHEKELAKEIYVEAMLCHANPDDGKLDSCIEIGKYHEQLVEWLEELKDLRELKDTITSNAEVLEIQGYNKAIDEFVKLVKKYDWDIRNRNENAFIYGAIDKIAEQLKAGDRE